MNLIDSCIKHYGADPEFIYSFQKDKPGRFPYANEKDDSGLLPYANIVNARLKGDEDLNLVGAVYEWQNSPLIFLVDGREKIDRSRLSNLRHKLAMRGDSPYMGVLKKKDLQIYQIALDGKFIDESIVDPGVEIADRHHLLSILGNIRPEADEVDQTWISNVILKLLNSTLSNLVEIGDVNENEAISLVGRALFARFLGDRDLLPARFAPNVRKVGELFDHPKTAEATSNWLDRTFNGDFLPLSKGVFSTLSEYSYVELGNVMKKSVEGQMYLGWEQKWNKLDFAHIPVGVLSQAYEEYLRTHKPLQQKQQSAYYTPPQLVNVMVRASIHAIKGEKDIGQIRILDPASGAGVFLITAFRELVAERWRQDGKSPDSKTLRKILETQITGFEVDESAIRFAALGLYLISIELDASLGTPKHKITKFNKLRGKVLFNWSEKGGNGKSQLGSLDPEASESHKGKYDIVVGNPPWSSKLPPSGWKKVWSHVNEIASSRQNEFPMPISKMSSDIAFLWYSMFWAKPNGQISLVLHARWLFKQGRKLPETRLAILNSLDINSIINCSQLRQTGIWKNNSAPFCLLLARNNLPEQHSGFRFINPKKESKLNKFGSLRIDPSCAEFVTPDMVSELPQVLKLYSSGSGIDFQIFQRIKAQNFPTFQALWKQQWNGDGAHRSGVGFSRFGNGIADKSAGDDSSRFIGWPEVLKEDLTEMQVSKSTVRKFSEDRVRTLRSPERYKGPLLLVHSVPDPNCQRIVASISGFNTMYNEAFYGYGIKRSKDCKLLSQYLYLIVKSKIALWQLLMLSGKFGVERDQFEKFELDGLLVPDFRSFSDGTLKELKELLFRIGKDDDSYDSADKWVAEQYGLRNRDLDAIADTLKFHLPFAVNRKLAEKVPGNSVIKEFCLELESGLMDISSLNNVKIDVQAHEFSLQCPWEFLEIRSHASGKKSSPPTDKDWQQLFLDSNSTYSTEIVKKFSETGLFVGKLKQARYWTKSQAQLLVQKILWTYPKFFKVGVKK